MDGSRDYNTNCFKSDQEKQISYGITLCGIQKM